ncbi:MAG: helix-turn-helix transcriptional regulator [Chlorobia bacterium]|nr:helix-turn-helix transcriptional regulator [Fimbriimonadaceae bacterium]
MGCYYRRVLRAGQVEAHAVVLRPGTEKPYSTRIEGLVVITLRGSMCAMLDGHGEKAIHSMSVSIHPSGQTGSGTVLGEGITMLVLAVPAHAYTHFAADGKAPARWTPLEFQPLGLQAAVEFSIKDRSSECSLEEITLELLSEGTNQVQEPSREPRWWVRLTEYMRENQDLAFSLATIAAAVGIDRGHLARTHRQVTGLTLGAKYRLDRLREGCRLISETNIPIGEIAARVGYIDHAHLTHAMSRVLGFPPSRLRHALMATESQFSLNRKRH